MTSPTPIVCAMGALLVVASGAGAAQWTVHKRPDPLEPTRSAAYATVNAVEGLSQFGKPVKAWLMARCIEQYPGESVWIGLSFNFSAPVAIGKIQARWRADQTPIQESDMVPKAHGRAFEMYAGQDIHPTVGHLKSGAKVLKADLLLPWAGPTVLTFNVDGSKQAFSQVRC